MDRINRKDLDFFGLERLDDLCERLNLTIHYTFENSETFDINDKSLMGVIIYQGEKLFKIEPMKITEVNDNLIYNRIIEYLRNEKLNELLK
jgi:hypothetical protein